MENDYLSFKSENVLRGMNESGFNPSPLNFVKERGSSLDNYIINYITLREGEQTPYSPPEPRELILRASGE
jgi:hypothetical protein